jgi:GT2 family glycosyltransferase
VVLTCFNRREKTLASLAALQASTGVDDVDLAAVLVDDGSTDGTAAAVRQRFEWVRVIGVGGGLFWCRGMHAAFEAALNQAHDFYLWLNDDTVLQPDALARLLACARAEQMVHDRPVLVVGSTTAEGADVVTYGGQRRAHVWRSTRFVRVEPSQLAQDIDTFNGNIVLVSHAAAERVGNLDPAFEHAMGDIDYGLRAQAAGVVRKLAPGTHGTCNRNPAQGTFADAQLSWRLRWRQILSRKELPWRSWWVFTRRHTGLAWPLFFAWPYVRLLGSMLSHRWTRH